MRFAFHPRTTARLAVVVILVTVLGGTAFAADSKARSTPAPELTYIPPDVGTTSANLQTAFANEVNTKEHYLAAATQADRENYPYVAQLFRACARAEEAHADLHVTAIAWGDGEAKAMLQRLALGTTADNLRVAVGLETYEATQVYPALLAKAREEHKSAAVRSMTLALAAERQHLQLFTEALETIDQHRPVATFHVCGQCGNTVDTLDFEKCPHCFAGLKRFVAVK